MGRLLTTRQVTKKLGISRSTLYRWEKIGQIPPRVNDQGQPRWDEDEVEKTFRAQRKQAAA